MPQDPDQLFTPLPLHSHAFRFLAAVNEKHSLVLSNYDDLYKWSTSHIDLFWSIIWDHCNIIGQKGIHVIDSNAMPSDNPPWFSGAKLNWAENMLSCRSPHKTALIQASEPTPNDPLPTLTKLSYSELYSLVADIVSALLSNGLKPGDRVASYTSNCIENVAACLATAAIGCIWVSAAADFGPDGVLERFEQVQPQLIFSIDAVVYNAKIHPHLPKVSELYERIPVKPKVVVINSNHSSNTNGWHNDWITWTEFLREGKEKKLGRTSDGEIQWSRQSFDWPLWILFSSGTTGKPKPIVHRAGGMLLQARKELLVCAGLTAEDVFIYYTTTQVGWMMWNFLVGALSVCTLVLYDGSPLHQPSYLWSLVDDLGITIFGTSAKYIDELSKCYKPRQQHKLTTLRHIYSTGSPLTPPLFDYVYQDIRRDILLGSITGGTDICSLFAGMCSALPVFRGEIQCRLLGMAIETFTPSGTICDPGEPGELVCLKPFPCQPLGFWPLPGYADDEAVLKAQNRHQQAYFEQYKGVWYHGDHVLITRTRAGNGGGLVMLGRSDGVLNPGGVRFGSAEIYDVLDTCFSASAAPKPAHMIVDYLAVGQTIAHGKDERVILFVKLMPGETLSAELERKIREQIRARRSARHVPAFIMQVSDIPYTLNGKRVEVPVKKIINGEPLSSLNPATLRNPEVFEEYMKIGHTLRAE